MASHEHFISLEQSVVRVLLLVYYAGTPDSACGPSRRIESNVKVIKLDFLLRNPDYLRQMLLVDARQALSSGNQQLADAYHSAAAEVEGTGEPALLAERMAKHVYGPFEHDYDSVYSYAIARRLMLVRQVEGGAPSQREVLLTSDGVARVRDVMLPQLAELAWYTHHLQIIARFYARLDGTAIERRLYERFPWIKALPNHSRIGSYEECHADWIARHGTPP